MSDADLGASMFIGVIAGMALLAMLQGFLFGAFDSPLEELKVDLDTFAGGYVKYQYPEYANCTTQFYYNQAGKEAVKVFCGSKTIDNRDGLKIVSGKQASAVAPDVVIEFENTTIEDIAKIILENYNYGQ